MIAEGGVSSRAPFLAGIEQEMGCIDVQTVDEVRMSIA